MDTPHSDPQAILDAALADLEILKADAARRDEDLHAAADDPREHSKLPELRLARSRTRKVVEEAEAKLPELRGAAAREQARKQAAAERERQEAEAAERARCAAEERRRVEEELAPLLAALEGAATKAREASAAASAAEASQRPIDATKLVSSVLGRRDKALAVAHSRAELAAEAVSSAVSVVAAKDERHPAAHAASAQVRSANVHAILADADELRTLASAARALNLAMLARLDAIVGARGAGALDIILAAVLRDAAVEPLPVVAAGRHTVVWIGVGATVQEALAYASRSAEGAHGLPADILGRLVLDGLVHEAGAVAAERERATELAARTAEFDSLVDRAQWCTHATPRGCVAARALEIGRAIGRFVDDAALEQHLEQALDEGIGQLTAEMLSDVHHGRYSAAGPTNREPMLIRWPNLPTREEQIAKVLGVPLSRVPSLESVAA